MHPRCIPGGVIPHPGVSQVVLYLTQVCPRVSFMLPGVSQGVLHAPRCTSGCISQGVYSPVYLKVYIPGCVYSPVYTQVGYPAVYMPASMKGTLLYVHRPVPVNDTFSLIPSPARPPCWKERERRTPAGFREKERVRASQTRDEGRGGTYPGNTLSRLEPALLHCFIRYSSF